MLKFFLVVLFVLIVAKDGFGLRVWPNTNDVTNEQKNDCGRNKINSLGLIQGGDSFARGKWPWTVALKKKSRKPNEPDKYFCGGTLISNTQVVTAAHCVFRKGSSKATLARDVKMFFGAYDLGESHESGVYVLTPRKILIHDDWNPFDDRYDADIAILITQENVPKTNYIQPICLWESENLPNIREGTIAGWGADYDSPLGYEEIPKELKIPIRTLEYCLLDNLRLALIASNRTFCGGSKNGRGPCNGDSGSGMFIEVDNVYYLWGIVSSSLSDSRTQKCDTNNFAIYTFVRKFIGWIQGKPAEHLPDNANDWLEDLKVTTQPYLPSQQESERISLKKCREYKRLKPLKCSSHTGLIVGGESTSHGEFSHMAAIGYYENYIEETGLLFKCGGSLISEKFVLTAAPCVNSRVDQPVLVRLGAHNLKNSNEAGALDYSIVKVIQHEKYSFRTKQNDIALIELDRIVTFNDFIRPACLHQKNDTDSTVAKVIATGWGVNSIETSETPDELLKVSIPITQFEACRQKFGQIEQIKINITQAVVCAGREGKDTCQGDSGGPIQISHSDSFCVYDIVGIASFGLGCGSMLPSVYTRVSFYLDWIERKVWSTEDIKHSSNDKIHFF